MTSGWKRSVQTQIDISQGRKDDFRREIMNDIGASRPDGKVEAYSRWCMPGDDLVLACIDLRGNKNYTS